MDFTKEISSWLAKPENNYIEPGSSQPCFAPPLVGIASGADELFSWVKHDIGASFYWTPLDSFRHAFKETDAQPEELRVVSWILPHTKTTKQSHRRVDKLPSIEWSKARHYGEEINTNLRNYLVSFFSERTIQACAPVLMPQFSRAQSTSYGFASSWSERHTAHVCGLGTFGLSDGLITPVGKAIRIGSVIVRTDLPPTPRTYQNHTEYCLHYSGGRCTGCIDRCPAKAISKNGHDKEVCKKYIRSVTAPHVEQSQLGFRVSSCGFCQTKVPCESTIPPQRSSSNDTGKTTQD